MRRAEKKLNGVSIFFQKGVFKGGHNVAKGWTQKFFWGSHCAPQSKSPRTPLCVYDRIVYLNIV